MRKCLIIGLSILFSGLCQAQESKLTLDVTVVDTSNKPILGVSVYLKELKVGGYTMKKAIQPSKRLKVDTS